MRINGRKLSANEEILVLPRPDGNVIIKARGISESKSFDEAVKPPVAPEVIKADGSRFRNFDDEIYRAASDNYGTLKTHWTILESLKATEGLEWEQVKLGDPTTWHLWEQELKESGFSEIEVMRVTHLVQAANSLDERKLNEARKAFLASLADQSAK